MTNQYPPGPPAAPEAPVPNRPLGLGDMFSGTWNLMKARYPAYLLVALLPMLVLLLVTLVAGVLALIGGVQLANGSGGVVLLVIAAVVWLVGYLALIYLSVRSQAMQVELTRATLEGRRPSVGDLWNATRGFFSRVLVLILLGFAVGLVLVLLFGGLMALTIVPLIRAAESGSSAGPGIAASVLLTLVAIACYLALIFVSIRLAPLVTVIALERRGGVDALKRAWSLTRLHFWRTLGYLILASLVPSIITQVVSSIFGAVGGGIIAAGSGGSDVPSPAAAILGLLVIMVPTLIVTVLVIPFTAVFSALYSMDLIRRKAGTEPVPPSEPGAWVPYPYPAPAGPFGQQYPPQQYPPQQYPGQGPQHPGSY